MNVNGGEGDEGDDNVKGRCNGTGFTAIRKSASSFANPNIKNTKPCCWDTGLKFCFIVL